MIKQILVAVSICVAAPASAEFFTGNQLLSKLESTNPNDRNFAYGYIAGAFDTAIRATHCTPDNVTLRQAVDMVQQLLISSPEHRHQSADRFVSSALGAAFPCKKKSNT